MKKLLVSLFAFFFVGVAAAQTPTPAPISITAQQVTDLGNGPLSVRVVGGAAFIGTSSSGCMVGSATAGATTITCQSLPATPPLVGAAISGGGVPILTTITSYNSGTGAIGLSSPLNANISAGQAISYGAACPVGEAAPKAAAMRPETGQVPFSTAARVCAFGVTDTFVLAVPMSLATTGSAYAFGLNAGNTTNVRSAYLANAGRVLIAANGDSTTRGVDETASPYNSQYQFNDVVKQVSLLLNSGGITSGAHNWFGLSGSSLTDYLNRDGRFSAASGVVLGSNQIQGGTEIRFPGVASSITYTDTAVNTCDVYWGDQVATGRVFSVTVDGGTTTNFTTSGTAQFAKTTLSLGAVGTHNLVFNWVSGGTTLLYGIDCRDSTRNELSFWQMGISGGTSANMIANSGTPGAGRIQQLTTFPVKLVITEMGVVNDARTSVTVATFKANTTSFVTSMKALNTDVILLTPPFDNGIATGNVVNQAQYVTAMYQVAAEQGIGIIDPQGHWVSYLNSVANGWQVSTDNVHLTKAGYADEAIIIAATIKSILTNQFTENDLPAPANDNKVTKYATVTRRQYEAA
jgi:hypothetical protein